MNEPTSHLHSYRVRPIAILELVCCSLALSAAACRDRGSPASAPPGMRVGAEAVSLDRDAPQWKYLEMATAREAEPLPPLPYPARVAIDEQRTSSVGAPLAGRVERVLVRIGDRVPKGARLFEVRSGALAELLKQVEGAEAQVSARRRIVDRARALVQLKTIPEKELQAAETELREAELALEAARAKRESLAVAPEAANLFWVQAPRAGAVVELDLTASQEVSPERDKPLLRISDLSQVLVLADVPEADAADIAVGSQALVRVHGRRVDRPGTVEHVSEVVNTARRSVEVRIRVLNGDGAFRPNGFAEVSFTPRSGERRVTVAADAVVTDGDSSVVFVARDQGRLERVTVVRGRQHGSEVELLSGLAPGTRYVARGALLLLNEIDLAR